MRNNEAIIEAASEAERNTGTREPGFNELRTDGLTKAQRKDVESMTKRGTDPGEIAANVAEYRKENIEASDKRLEAHERARPRAGQNLAEMDEWGYYRRLRHEDVGAAPIPQSNNVDSDFTEFGIAFKDGRIWSKGTSQGASPHPISNFIFSIIYQFDNGTTNTERLIKYENNDNGDVGTMILDDKTLASVSDIQAAFSSRGCVFSTLNRGLLSGILRRLYLYHLKATKIEQLGYVADGDVYAFANGIVLPNKREFIQVNEHGIASVDTDKGTRCYYLPAYAEHNINNPSFEDARQLCYCEPTEKNQLLDHSAFFRLLRKAWGWPAFIGGLYLANSLMFDIVFAHTNYFPFLFLFGEQGTGKTTFINTLLGTIGKGYKGDSFSSTSTAICRKLNQVNNSVVYLKEYTDTLDDEIVGKLKCVYDGQSYTIGQRTTDNKTKSFISRTGIIADGNDLPTKEAPLYDRFIVLELRESTFTKEQTEAFNELRKANEQYTLTSVTKELLHCRETYKARFATFYDAELGRLKKDRLKGYDNRTIGHTAFILAAFNTLMLEGVWELDEEGTLREGLENELVKMAEIKKSDIQQMSEVSTFWQCVAPAIEYQINNTIPKERNKADVDIETATLYISLKPLYQEYAKECSKTHTKKASLVTLKKYLTGKAYQPFAGDFTKKNKKLHGKSAKRLAYNLEKVSDTTFEIDGVELNLSPIS